MEAPRRWPGRRLDLRVLGPCWRWALGTGALGHSLPQPRRPGNMAFSCFVACRYIAQHYV
eukprot:scaffold1854_cov113-Isochrysis_galbana.AAC.19